MAREISARLPTRYGEWVLHAYPRGEPPLTHLALVMGELDGAPPPLVRIHSECLTGDLFGSSRCDCGTQLERSLERIADEGRGALIYLRQEGRGIGLLAKLAAYNLQDDGLDTVDANLHLGFEADRRDYRIAVEMLDDLGVTELRLLTNNPDKIAAFEESVITVTERVPLLVRGGSESARYLETKRRRLGHLLVPPTAVAEEAE